jgi:hypothetical protein
MRMCVGEATLPLRPRIWCAIVASLLPDPPGDVAAALGRRLTYDQVLTTAALPSAPPWVNRLAL